MRKLLLAVVVLVGCGRVIKNQPLTPEQLAARAAAQREHEQEMARIDREHQRQEALAREQAVEDARREAEADEACRDIDTPEMNRICAAREREKDRRAQREQWERENAYREREAAIREHDLEIRRQALEIERDEARRKDIERAFTPPAPTYQPPAPTVNCTSLRTGDLVTTSCR